MFSADSVPDAITTTGWAKLLQVRPKTTIARSRGSSEDEEEVWLSEEEAGRQQLTSIPISPNPRGTTRHWSPVVHDPRSAAGPRVLSVRKCGFCDGTSSTGDFDVPFISGTGGDSGRLRPFDAPFGPRGRGSVEDDDARPEGQRLRSSEHAGYPPSRTQ